jgi:hypothetical protein
MKKYLLIALLVLFPAADSSASEPLFDAPLSVAVGDSPYSVVIGDFNEDGHTDLVVANYLSNDITILFGAGNGTFVDKIDYEVDGLPHSVTTGDFNEDGHTDLAVAARWIIRIMLGEGDGTFISHGTCSAPERLFSIAAEDFDEDGHQDLVVVSQAGPDMYVGYVSILTGNGDGTFASAETDFVCCGSCAVITGDFNEDGHIDLAVANSGSWSAHYGTVSIFLGAGDGTFASPVHYSTGDYSTSVASEDFNEDGHLDLAVTNSGRFLAQVSSLSILLGSGDGTFSPAVNYETAETPDAVTCGDFEKDGHVDIAVANMSADSISVFLGNGDGTFDPMDNYVAGGSPHKITTGDFYEDGYLDLAVANYSSDDISVLINIAGGIASAELGSYPRFTLRQNYPNPFNPSTVIHYSIPERSHVTLDIFDVSGRRIARIEDSVQDAGSYQKVWSGYNEDGAVVSSGVYFCRLTSGKNYMTKKMILMH